MRLILAEDSTLLRQGLVSVLRDEGFEVLRAVPDAPGLLDAVAACAPDVVVTDIRMPPTFTDDGLAAALEIRRDHPTVGVLVLSQYLEAAYAVRLLDARATGGVGYLLKDRITAIPTFADAVRRVGAGESVIDPAVIRTLVHRPRRDNPLDRLTEREREVLALMAEGRSNRGIGERLFLSPKTVENHVGAVLSKLGLRDSPDENRRVLAVLTFLHGEEPVDHP